MVTGQQLKEDFTGVAGSAAVPDICQAEVGYRASASRSPATYTHPNWDSSWCFCVMQSSQEPGASSQLPRIVLILSLSKGNFRKEQMLAYSAQSSTPWQQVYEQLYSYKACLHLAKTSPGNAVSYGWMVAPKELPSVPLRLGMPNSCEQGKAAEKLCWTTHIHSAKRFQQLLFRESTYSSQQTDIARRSVLCSEVTQGCLPHRPMVQPAVLNEG